MNSPVTIEWDYSGKPNGFFGTGATLAEKATAYGAATGLTAAIGYSVVAQDLIVAWSLSFWVMLALACDVAGGVTANMLNSAKRYYHAPLQPSETGFNALTKNHFGFVMLHIHPILAAWAAGGDVFNGLLWYGLLVCSTLIVRFTPLYLQRPMASSLVVAAIIANLYWLPLAIGMEWFIPCLFFKIVLAHAVREEPYRPRV